MLRDSKVGINETDRGASSSVSVDAPQRISTEAVSISYQNLEEVNSCLDHGSRDDLIDPSSPRVMQDNLVDTDAQRFASLQSLSVERVNPDGGSLGIMASSFRGKEKVKKKDKEKKRKREDHKGTVMILNIWRGN
ncbi:hypothetical protein NC653_034058 [Populus alba x Populus x berolinensis]|uniref:Uncharacterized protein n=1 Tax=Populus alba x Populus x berolinensis TaxID=444605 RepID=A0AAD6PVR8_9ROSI|nr:hypothetical protein NC653_034058 [Populus alba x Populus x berolinensis]